jgi:hypothetical protein
MKQRVDIKSRRDDGRRGKKMHGRSLNKYNFRHGLAYITYSRRDLGK